MDRIWITWEIQRRNRTTSESLGANLFELTYGKRNSWLRYPLSITKTLKIFLSEKPKIIFAQNPSILLAFFSVWYGFLLRVPVVIDAHNAGIHPFLNRKRWANVLAKNIMRFATLTIVTNDPLANYVIKQGGHPFVLPDPLPEFKLPSSLLMLQGKINILFICTWAEDEPYLEVLKAASQIEKNVFIYITGNSKGKERLSNMPLPANVVLTGYLDEEDYVKLLFSSDIIIDLTTRENCLVCGAYEAVSAEKPMILSDSEVLRNYFHKGAEYTDNLAKDIAQKIRNVIDNYSQLIKDIRELKDEISIKWLERKSELDTILKQLELDKKVRAGLE